MSEMIIVIIIKVSYKMFYDTIYKVHVFKFHLFFSLNDS